MKKKAMISQPMAGRTDFEIQTVRDAAIIYLEDRGYEVVDTFFKDEWDEEINSLGIVHRPLFFLAKSLEKMAECDAVYFCDGWDYTRGCQVEYEAAIAYGLEILCGDGQSLEEIEYGNDITDAFCEKIERISEERIS